MGAIKRGLFWRIKLAPNEYECFTVSEEHTLGEAYEPMNHKREWDKLSRSVTRGKAFDYFPRGRVEIKRSKATIYLNPVLYTDEFISTVKQKFGLITENGITEISVKADNSYHYHFHEED